jgi:putative ABC transport system permease protein
MSSLLTGTAVEGRRALRGLAASPGFSIGVVLVLGIAIAGTVTVATAAYELFLRPLPYPRVEQLVQITMHSRSMGFDVGFAPPMLVQIREEPMIADLAAWYDPATEESEEGESWRVAAVTYNLADVLGIRPVAGRAFMPADAEAGASPVGLISEAVWRNRFGADESVIGRELVLEDRRVRVIGVMPATFRVPTADTELWQVLRYTPEQLTPSERVSFSGTAMLARLVPAYSAADLQDALRIRYGAGGSPSSRILALMGLEPNVRGLRQAWTAGQREPLTIIGLASLLVLAAALFNVAGLWLTRLLGRSHEYAVQAALGAGGVRRLARTIFEFLLLGAAGACMALALTPFVLRWLQDLEVLDPSTPFALRTGAATLFITVILLGVSSVPVLAAACWQQRRQRRELVAGLVGGGRGAAGAHARARQVLIVAQVALAMSVLCAMGLLLRSWYQLLNEDLGFEPGNLLLAWIESPPGEEDRVGPDPVAAAALEAVRGIPGVLEVSHASVAPFARSESVSSLREPGHEDRETTVRSSWVGERYFETIGIPIVHGKSFEAGDQGVIVDEYFADRYFPDGAVGKTLRMAAGPDGLRDVEIIGVAATVKFRSPDEAPTQGTLYRLSAEPYPSGMAVISIAVPPAGLLGEVQASLERVLGPDRVRDIATMENLVRLTVREREPQLVLLALYGVETMALAGIGLFSLLAWSVRARTAEFGVRQAVGAKASDIRRHVVGDALRLLVPGLLAGAAGAWAAGQVVSSRLYHVSPVDPATWISVCLLLASVVLVAGLWPAERAARIQPTEALRHE